MLSDECALLREWVGSHAPVFFHFGGEQLWWILKGNSDGSAYVAGFPVSEFMKIHIGGATQDARDFEGFLKDLSELVSQYESPLRTQALKQASPIRAQGFQRYQTPPIKRRGRL